MEQITVIEALSLVQDKVQWCRENGDSDMRSVLYMVIGLMEAISKEVTRDEIMDRFSIKEDLD